MKETQLHRAGIASNRYIDTTRLSSSLQLHAVPCEDKTKAAAQGKAGSGDPLTADTLASLTLTHGLGSIASRKSLIIVRSLE